MSTVEYLESMIEDLNKGISKSLEYPNSSTDNLHVASMFLVIKDDLNHVIKELLKGNAK